MARVRRKFSDEFKQEAVRLVTGQGRKIHYDGEAMRVTNAPEANVFLSREYRSGFGL